MQRVVCTCSVGRLQCGIDRQIKAATCEPGACKSARTSEESLTGNHKRAHMRLQLHRRDGLHCRGNSSVVHLGTPRLPFDSWTQRCQLHREPSVSDRYRCRKLP
jgi:hypothetical protein